LSMSFPVSVFPTVCQSICISVPLYICPFVCQSICISVPLYICPFVCQFICISVPLSVSPCLKCDTISVITSFLVLCFDWVSFPVHLSICLSTHLHICPPHSSLHTSTHLSRFKMEETFMFFPVSCAPRLLKLMILYHLADVKIVKHFFLSVFYFPNTCFSGGYCYKHLTSIAKSNIWF